MIFYGGSSVSVMIWLSIKKKCDDMVVGTWEIEFVVFVGWSSAHK